MRDEDKTKEQLINELIELRQQLTRIEKFETQYMQTTLAQLQQVIAERELVEQALQEQLRFSQQLIDTIPNSIFYKDKKGLYQGCNAAFEAATGLTKKEIIGKSVYDIAPKDLADKCYKMDSLLFSEPGVQVYESSVLYADGTIHDVIIYKATFLNTDGNVAGLVGVIIDISERNQAEEALRESEERYRQLVELSPDKISVLSEGKIVFINNAGAKLLGIESPEELIGKPVMDIIHPDYKKIVKERIRQIQEEGKTAPLIKEKLIRLDGTVVDVEVTAVPFTFQGKPAVQAIARDITERKRVEEALVAEQRRLFSLLDGLPALVYLQAPDYSIRFSNLYFWERFGKPGKKPCYEVIHGREEPCKECPTFRIFDTKSPFKWESIESDGRTYQFYTYPFSDIDGSPLVLVLGIDINDRKQAEAALRLSEERFSKAFNTSPNPMVISTFTDGRYIEVNDSFLAVSGYCREEVIDRTVFELNLWERPEDRAIMLQILKEQGTVRNLECNFRMKSGEVRVGLLSAELIDLNDEQCMLLVANDITERKQLEKEMGRLDRLHLIGETAAGIGHEIRNPMTTVRGFLQMLEGKEECAKYKDYYDLMIEELDRANSIITEFLSLAKNKAIELSEHNLNSIVKAIYPLIQADAIRMENYIKLDLVGVPNLLLDEREIRQLILNLVRNGLEAMFPGGNLTIRTYTDSDEVVLAVHDQGQGIEPETMEKIGTPFFTTKDNGTGLGLAVCYSIAARHNAIIKVETSPNGTTFFVRFKPVIRPCAH